LVTTVEKVYAFRPRLDASCVWRGHEKGGEPRVAGGFDMFAGRSRSLRGKVTEGGTITPA
jgi:hypothetical protein